jgi:hypothetical protein
MKKERLLLEVEALTSKPSRKAMTRSRSHATLRVLSPGSGTSAPTSLLPTTRRLLKQSLERPGTPTVHDAGSKNNPPTSMDGSRSKEAASSAT